MYISKTKDLIPTLSGFLTKFCFRPCFILRLKHLILTFLSQIRWTYKRQQAYFSYFRIARFEREFFKLVDTSTAASKVELSLELVDFIYRYWILKRRAGGNKALLVPRGEEESLSSVKGEDTERDKMKMLVGIRQVWKKFLIKMFSVWNNYSHNCSY